VIDLDETKQVKKIVIIDDEPDIQVQDLTLHYQLELFAEYYRAV